MLMVTVVAATLAANADAIAIQSTLARWRQLAKDTKSLVVEFAMTRRDRATGREDVYDCMIRLLRTDSDTLAKLVTRNRATKGVFECVLRNGRYHLPNAAAKSLLIYKPETVLPTAAGVFSPLLTALLMEKPEPLFSLKVSMREKFYTHLDFTPKDRAAKADSERGRVVVVHRTNDQLPVGVPRQLWHDLPGGQTRVALDIEKWEMNGKNPPRVEEFNVPGEKEGWKVTVTEGFWKDLQKRRTDK